MQAFCQAFGIRKALLLQMRATLREGHVPNTTMNHTLRLRIARSRSQVLFGTQSNNLEINQYGRSVWAPRKAKEQPPGPVPRAFCNAARITLLFWGAMVAKSLCEGVQIALRPHPLTADPAAAVTARHVELTSFWGLGNLVLSVEGLELTNSGTCSIQQGLCMAGGLRSRGYRLHTM